MIVIKPPERIDPKLNHHLSIFLAGSIEMGFAEKWQDRFVHEFSALQVVIYNPRRDDWDSSWEQSIHNHEFRKQVEWELDHLEKAAIVAMYFDKDTMSPITLLELGLCSEKAHVVVCCPPGYWRKGNVEIVCNRYGHILTESWNEFSMLVTGKIYELAIRGG